MHTLSFTASSLGHVGSAVSISGPQLTYRNNGTGCTTTHLAICLPHVIIHTGLNISYRTGFILKIWTGISLNYILVLSLYLTVNIPLWRAASLFHISTSKFVMRIIRNTCTEYTGKTHSFLGTFAKLRKVTIGFVMSVRLSLFAHQSARIEKKNRLQLDGFFETWYLSVFQNLSIKFKFY
jgi:hypothetical protein